jgi:methyl-accepting chemotaxis protein
MPLLRDFSVRARFLGVMAVVSASLLGLGLWGLVSSRSANETTARLFDRSTAAAAEIGTLREALSNLRRDEAAMIAVAGANPSGVEDYAKSWKADLAAVRASGERLVQAHGGDAEVAALVAAQGKQLEAYAVIVGPIAEQLQQARIDAAVALAYAGKAEDSVKQLQAGTDALRRLQQARLGALRGELADGAALAAQLRLVLVGATLALFLPLMWLTLRSIAGPLDEAIALAHRIARGDLGSRAQVQGRDEPAQLMHALLAMQDELRRVVGQVRATADSVEVASTEVASGNQDLSQRTEQTAASLQQTAAAMQQLTGNVRHSAEAAGQADQFAASASAVARRGGEVVAQVVSTMEEISASSRRIADIIGVIDGIAFQTNILALNAAVEAARAGEQGRGFAVVAGEVRSLAQRSAEAAKEIKALIGGSVDKVEAGSRLVQDAGRTMEEIVASVRRVSDIVGEISAASAEQSGGIGQVDQAVGQLDRMTQQNAALVEESAAAAESLREQARQLSTIVATFQLENGVDQS